MLHGLAAELRQGGASAWLTEFLPAAVYVYDIERRRSVFLNQFASQLLGYCRDEIMTFETSFLGRGLHPDDAAAVAAHLDQIDQLEDGATASVEYRLRHRDGSWRWFLGHDAVLSRDGRGRVRQVLGIAADITERKEAECLLARDESQLRTLFSVLDEGLCLGEVVTDGEGRVVDHRFLSVNPLFEDMTGMTGITAKTDVTGRTAREVLPDVDTAFLETCARVALSGESVRLGCGPSLNGRWLDIFIVPMSPRGRFAVVFRDQTERHRAEQALRENEAAERSGRLRAERVTELLTELGSVEGARLRLKRLVEFLTAELADRTSVEIPGSPSMCLAVSNRSSETSDSADVETRSRLDVPVELGQGVRGLLVLQILDPDREPFSPDDEAFVQEVAACAGLVLTKASLREEEHRTSLRLQRALLPDTLRVHPDVLIDAHYEAASTQLEVGGDWYDSYSWPQGQLGVMVGDVMGHDLSAAVAMGRLRAGVGALVTQVQPRACEVLEALDRCASGPDGTEFVTACAVVIDPKKGELRYSRAGHPPVLLVPPVGEPIWLNAAASVPVSGLSVGRRPEAVLRIEPGSVAILFSDGLIERRGESLVQGLVRLRRAAVRLVRSGEPDLASQLAAALAEESIPEDDVVVVTVRYRPGGVAADLPAVH